MGTANSSCSTNNSTGRQDVQLRVPQIEGLVLIIVQKFNSSISTNNNTGQKDVQLRVPQMVGLTLIIVSKGIYAC